MKLSKKLLAFLLAAAMLLGMVAVGVNAEGEFQLDPDVPTLTADDCANFDPVNNPYKVKLGFKVYKVNVDDGSYELIEDSNASNDTNDVNVEAGDVLRVELWGQTNFHVYNMQITPAYSNAWLLPTGVDYSTFAMKAANPAGVNKTAFFTIEEFEGWGAGDGTFEYPVFSNEALTYSKLQTNHNSYGGLKAVLPPTWQGTGTAATNWYSKTNADILDASGNLKYNVYQCGAGYSASGDEAWGSYATVLNCYQPLVAFNLTVDASAKDGDVADLFIPEESYLYEYAGAKPTTFVQVLYNVENGANYDPSMPQVTPGANLPGYKDRVTYADGTVTDKVWDIQNAKIIVGAAGSEPETETTTEAPTEPPVEYADLAALKAAIAAAANADTANCTADSIARFEAALAAANALNVEGTLKADQGKVDDAAAELVAAQAALTKLGKCDYAALDAAIADYDALVANQANYSNWAAYKAAYDAAKAVTRDMYDTGDNQATINAAAKALTDAKAALALKAADYAKVEEAKAAAAALDRALYTAASLKAVDDAVAAVVTGYDITKQADVDAMAKAINDAIAGLAKLGKVDYAALNAAIAAFDALDKNAYTPNSWTASDVDALAAAAKAVEKDMFADEAGVNQAKADDAAAALNAAIAKLVKVADKAALAAAIAAAPTDADAYTPDTWAPFAAALAEANAVNADANATQDAVDAAVAALADAQGDLALKADKSALAQAIAGAESLDAEDYTPASWAAAAIADVIAAAKAVNDDANASDADVAAAIQSLRDAALLLVEKADTEALEEAIDTLPAIKEEDADPESWAAYEAALAAAELVFADANATQDEVDKAEADLLAAISAVKEKDVVYCDYTALDAAIKAFEALDAAQYTPASYAIVKAYYDAAKAVARDMEFTLEAQDEIDFAADELNNSIALDLVKVADKAALKAAIDTVVDTANCTSASIAKYEAALAAAEAVYADANATQDAVDAAAEALVAAQTLEKLPKVDYSDLEDAMAKFEDLDAAEWTDDSYAAAKKAYDAAAALLAQDLYDDEEGQNATLVDEAVDALNAAIAALEKAVDKTALKAEIDKAPSIEEDLATDDSWSVYVDALANAEDVYADDAATQDEVDDAAAELAAANAALATRGLVDYTALDAALALVPELAEGDYTAKSWKAYADAKAAAEAIARDLVDNKAGTNAKLVADAAAALEAAFAALKVNAANITDVKYDNTGVYTTAQLDYDFYVNGAASKIQVLSPDGGTMTFDRRSSKVTIVSYNEAGEVVDYAEEDPAYEVWTIKLGLNADDYQVRAKYDYTWDTEYYVFTVEFAPYNTVAESFTASVGEYVDATAVTAVKGDVVTFKAVTADTAIKIQFVFEDGGTSTYTTSKAVDNGDGTLTWTITRVVQKDISIDLKVKAPTGWATEFSGNVTVDVQ